MDDVQRPRQPAMAQPHDPATEMRERDGADGEAGAPEAGGIQMEGAVPRDEAGGPGPGDDGTQREARRQHRSFWRELPVLIAVALALTVLIKVFAVQAFYIPSSSMEDTLNIGDRILVNKVVYHFRGIHRGDIVVFNGLDSWDPSVPQTTAPSNPVKRFANWAGSAIGVTAGEKDYVKRVIGVPGDQVKCCDSRGRVSVNGVALNEGSYLYPGNAPSLIPFNVTVPPGELWVMGDHRAVSYDSREHRSDPGGGSIPESKVIGRAFVIVWPVSRLRILPIPATFAQAAFAAGAPAAPLVLGFAGAVPVTLLQRRIRARRRTRHAEPTPPG